MMLSNVFSRATRLRDAHSWVGESANLDFLRSVAVLLVVYNHVADTYFLNMGLGPRFGRLGVLMFFVHTSLVLMMSLERQQARGEPLLTAFYIRRAFRIYPSAIFCVMLAVVCPILLGGDGQKAAVVWKDLWSNLLLVQNLTGSPSLIAVLWSLPYEVQMYLVLPPLYLLVRRYPTPVVMFAAWVAACAASIAVPQVYGLRFIPCFMGGIFAYQLSRRARIAGLWWPCVIAALIILFLTTDPRGRGWYTCVLLGAAIPQFQEIRFHPVVRAAHYIAKYSYGIYLIHEPLIRIGFNRLTFLPSPLRLVATLIIVAAGSVALYHAIESPMIALGARIAARCWRRRGGATNTSVAGPPVLSAP
jgi:peptidoglycan/LPS O-acetylase OafA/YrhL